ncbi:MAG: HDIG domain-containing metalloprotein [Flavobacteriaceae bacterium]
MIVYLFPKGVYFKYDLQKGKAWQNESLYAPFDFAVQKSKEDIQKEKFDIKNNKQSFFIYKPKIAENVINEYDVRIRSILRDTLQVYSNKEDIIAFGRTFLQSVYNVGYTNHPRAIDKIITIRKGNKAIDVLSNKLLTKSQIALKIEDEFKIYPLLLPEFKALFNEILKPNVFFDENLTVKALNEKLDNILATEGKISKGDLIISKGKILEGKQYRVLNSLKKEYNLQGQSSENVYWLYFGYTILVALALMMLLLFLRKYRIEIFENNTKITFIFFNILMMVFLVTLAIKYQPDYLFAVPLIILPIVLKAFFDARLGLITHVLTVLLLGFIVPNSFEFIFLQIIAGIVTILTVSELYKRANLFISISQITFTYMLAYLAFFIIQEGTAVHIKGIYFALFALNGLLALLAQYLIWIYEKVFGLVSDVTLLELSNTNSKLLRELNEKAPGTFQHSMQVANLAEASANEIGANAMLVRTGALYHDIGKMLNPMYFTENQATNVNPHNELSPKDSAKIIIDHIIKGIELAKKNGLPDRVIDFIRTHHGTSLVYYFYKQQEALTPDEINPDDFRYPGPIPFSKETAILMMADASEAASKSLKEPTAQLIDDLIDKVIDGQMNNGQYMNADITFKEINQIKKVIKKKVKNIYHVRIEYPE